MKAVWPKMTLGEICGFVRGPFGGSLKKSVFVADGFAVYEQQHAIYDQFDDIRYFIDDAKFAEMQRFELRPNDLIMSCSGTMGKVAIVPDNIRRGIINQALLKLTPKKTVSPEFLKYWMDSSDFQDSLKEQSGGAAIQNVASVNMLKEIQISLPPLAEQHRIVGILDEAFEGLARATANAGQNLRNARALFESYLQSVFTQRGEGWKKIHLAEVCERLHQGLNTAGEKVKFYDSGYPIIQTRNIVDGIVELDSKIKFMCEEDWQLYKDKYRPEVGDVFFTNIGTIGKTAIVTTDRDYLIHWNIFKLRPYLEKITSEFLRYTLEELTLSGYFVKLQKGGTVDFVTKKMISEALIYLPNIPEQKQIVTMLDDLREETQRLESIYQYKLAALDELKKSLLHQAFNGELTKDNPHNGELTMDNGQ